MGSTVRAPLPTTDREFDPYTPPRPLSPLPAPWRSLPRAFVVQPRARWSGEAMADSTDLRLTYGKTLIGALALGRALARRWGRAQTSACWCRRRSRPPWPISPSRSGARSRSTSTTPPARDW